jgi:AIPR protein
MNTTTNNTVNNTDATLRFASLADITTEQDTLSGIEHFVGQAPIKEVLHLPTDGNVRGYLAESNPKRMTHVHREIYRTLETQSEVFAVLNGGLTITAEQAAVDTEEGIAVLKNPSVINGAQTLGVLQKYLKDCEEQDIRPNDTCIKFEVIVTDDADLAALTAIARNTQNAVKRLSTVGRMGRFDEIDTQIKINVEGKRLQLNESDTGTDTISTEKLLQILTCLIPSDLWVYSNNPQDRSRAYTKKSTCLEDFNTLYKIKYEDMAPSKPDKLQTYIDLYDFMVGFASQAWEIYQKWNTHEGWSKLGLRNGVTVANGQVTSVNDGILFPIISALSNFIKKTPQGWSMQYPEAFDEQDLINSVRYLFVTASASNPSTMGKTKSNYVTLSNTTAVYVKAAKRTRERRQQEEQNDAKLSVNTPTLKRSTASKKPLAASRSK